MKIEYMDVNEIIPYENNPRNNNKAVKMVQQSIKDVGFRVPLIVNKDGVIICGHTRFQAAKKEGLKILPVIVAKDLDDAKEKAFRLVDNKSQEYATWDVEKLKEEILQIVNIDLGEYEFTREDIVNDLKQDGFSYGDKNADTFSITLNFTQEDYDKIEKYGESKGKNSLVDAIVEICKGEEDA